MSPRYLVRFHRRRRVQKEERGELVRWKRGERKGNVIISSLQVGLKAIFRCSPFKSTNTSGVPLLWKVEFGGRYIGKYEKNRAWNTSVSESPITEVPHLALTLSLLSSYGFTCTDLSWLGHSPPAWNGPSFLDNRCLNFLMVGETHF